MYNKTMTTTNLNNLIIKSWENAENNLRKSIKEKYYDIGEETITTLFYCELRVELALISENKEVERAYYFDLQECFPDICSYSLLDISSGLIASVSFHSRRTEGKTGGDMGIVTIRPDVQKVYGSTSQLEIKHDYKCGLLCQAKIYRKDLKWGSFTSNQQEILANRLGYFTLLLYKYIDNIGERRNLAPFEWQITKGANLDEVKSWLNAGEFPSIQGTRDILNGMMTDNIGTNDKDIIKKYISPENQPTLVIRVHWRDDSRPDEQVWVQEKNTVRSKQLVNINY